MKFKIIFLALLFSMCSNVTQETSQEIKVVSLSTTHTEIIQSLNARETLVAIDSFSEVDFPVQVIDAYTVTAEELAPLNPDVVILAFDFNGIVEGLENQELNYVLLPPAKNIEEVYLQIETIGSLVNKESEAFSTIRDMKIEINRILDNANFGNTSVYHEIGYSYGIYSVNSNSLIGQIYNSLGVTNIANNTEDPFGSGYPSLTEEQIIESNPEYIVIGHSDYLNKDLSTRMGWEDINAIENSNVYFLDENLANNWGTTTVDLVKQIALTFEESTQTNPYSDYLLLISLLILVMNIFFSNRINTKERV
ncbi:MAG: ABC transporter substrate-binding protein [Actinomycetota bacterium]|nr:ABC transporter substrate-binding protein [Actinomycetota bacterium]MDA3037723.1 ABC transporter substrate-binding protein [Actinomycetota bacterium]